MSYQIGPRTKLQAHISSSMQPAASDVKTASHVKTASDVSPFALSLDRFVLDTSVNMSTSGSSRVHRATDSDNSSACIVKLRLKTATDKAAWERVGCFHELRDANRLLSGKAGLFFSETGG